MHGPIHLRPISIPCNPEWDVVPIGPVLGYDGIEREEEDGAE